MGIKRSRKEKEKINRIKSEVVDRDKHITYQWSEGGAGHYTKQEDMYLDHFERMLPSFKGGSVLEVGPGTGEFAKRMFGKYKICEYNILDLERNIYDSRRFLDSYNIKANYVFSQDYENLFDTDITLFVSNICLPEVPEYYCHNLVENMFLRSEYAFVTGGNEFSNYRF